MTLLLTLSTFNWITTGIIVVALIGGYILIRKKLYLEFSLNLMIALAAIFLPRWFDWIDSQDEKETFATLNRPYLEPTFEVVDLRTIKVNLKNTGNLPADSSWFYIEYGKNLQSGSSFSEIAPKGSREAKILMGDDNPLYRRIYCYIYYTLTIDEKTQSFESEYTFMVDRGIPGEYKGTNANHYETTYRDFVDKFETKSNAANDDEGSLAFWIEPEDMSKNVRLPKTDSINCFWIGEENKFVFEWQVDSACMVHIEWKVVPRLDDRNMFFLIWKQTEDSIIASLNLNDEPAQRLEYLKEE